MIITVPASIESVATRKDRTIVLRVGTMTELPGKEMAVLMNLSQKEGVFAFSESHISPDQLKTTQSTTSLPKTQESPSQRLRKRMYTYYTSKNEESGFKAWYERTLNEIGQRYLDKI